MTQRPALNPLTRHKALAGFLAKAKEHTLRAYLDTVLGALMNRALTTKSGVDDIAVVVITVLVDRLFPSPSDGPVDPQSALNDGIPPGK